MVQQLTVTITQQATTNTEVTSRLQESQVQTRLLADQLATSRARRPEGLLDPKMVGKVKQFDGHRGSWKTWEFHWKAWHISQEFRWQRWFQQVETTAPEVMNHVMEDDMQRALSTQLYYALIMAMPEDSVGEMIMRNCPEGEGAVAWKRLLKEYSPNQDGDVVNLFRQLVATKFQKDADITVEIGRLDETITRYQKASGETISENITRGVLLGALENEPELQSHIFRNMSSLATYADVKNIILTSLAAQRSIQGPMPMEIGALGKGKKGKGKGKEKGKDGGAKGKGKDKGKSKTDKSKLECYYCGKTGHIKSECRSFLADQKKKEQGNGGEAQNTQSRKARKAAALEAQSSTASAGQRETPGDPGTARVQSLTVESERNPESQSEEHLHPKFIFMLRARRASKERVAPHRRRVRTRSASKERLPPHRRREGQEVRAGSGCHRTAAREARREGTTA